jgi:hypothetical protein
MGRVDRVEFFRNSQAVKRLLRMHLARGQCPPYFSIIDLVIQIFKAVVIDRLV